MFNNIADWAVESRAKFVERFRVNRQIVPQSVYRATADTVVFNQFVCWCGVSAFKCFPKRRVGNHCYSFQSWKRKCTRQCLASNNQPQHSFFRYATNALSTNPIFCRAPPLVVRCFCLMFELYLLYCRKEFCLLAVGHFLTKIGSDTPSLSAISHRNTPLSFAALRISVFFLIIISPPHYMKYPLDKSSLSWYYDNKDWFRGCDTDYSISKSRCQGICGIFLAIPQI